MGFIYSIKNMVNGHQYIGQTRCKKVERRWNQHRTQPGGLLERAFNAHGIDAFDFTVICEIPTEELNDREIQEIRDRNTLAPNGYNLQTGGNSHGCHPYTRKKLSEQKKGNTYNFGKKTPPETIAKMKEAHSGPNHHMYGKHLPDWVKDVLRKSQPSAKKVDQYTNDGDLVQTWDSIKHAARTLGMSDSHISECCKGQLKTYKSFVWRYHGVPFDAGPKDPKKIEDQKAKCRARWANRTPEQVEKEKERMRKLRAERKNKKIKESNGHIQRSPTGDALSSVAPIENEGRGDQTNETREG
jgi:group I intron endonuclease